MSEGTMEAYEDQLTLLRSHKPRNVVRDGRLYCDGIEVFREQLTPEELKQWFPEDYAKTYSDRHVACPICLAAVDGNKKASIVQHVRGKHTELWAEKREDIVAAGTVQDVIRTIKPPPNPDDELNEE